MSYIYIYDISSLRVKISKSLAVEDAATCPCKKYLSLGSIQQAVAHQTVIVTSAKFKH